MLPPSSSLSHAAIFDCCVIVICHTSYHLHCHHHVARCHHCLLLSPPLLLAGLHRPIPDAGWFLFVRYSHRRRSVVGKHRPQLAVVAVRHSLSSLLTAHAHRCPHAFGGVLREGACGRMYPMHCLIIVIMVIHHSSSPSSVSVINRPLCPPLSLSVVHHIIFIVQHDDIFASSSRPPSYWLDCIIQSPTLVGFCLSDIVIAVGPSSASTTHN